MIIDAKKDKISFSRQCGKTNLRIKIFEAWLESYYTGKPVEVKYEMVEVRVR